MPARKRERSTSTVSPSARRRIKTNQPPADCITLLKSRINECGEKITDLTDPKKHALLPFPSPFRASLLFPDDNKNEIEIFGRAALKTLYDKAKIYIEDKRKPATKTLLYGPAGVGKSRLLAALTLMLLREGVCAIYIPDCSAFDTDFTALCVIKDALAVALPDTYSKRTKALDSLAEVPVFLQTILEPCVLIADRWDAVPPDSKSYEVLSSLSYLFPTFYAARPIKPHYPNSSIGDSKNLIFRVERLCADELSAWLKRNKLSRISRKDRHDIEYLTGSVPRLLNSLIEQSTSGRSMYDVILKSNIVRETLNKINTSLDERFAKHGPKAVRYYLEACVQEETLPYIHGGYNPEIYDHEYTYFDEAGVGHCIAGIAWEVIVDKLRGEVGTLLPSVKWTRVINKYTKGSPTARGSMVEKAAIAAISEGGIGSIHHLDAQPIVKTFTGVPPFHLLEANGDLFLMVPGRFNYEAIDAILVKRTDSNDGTANRKKKEKDKLAGKRKKAKTDVIHLFPIQVTIAREHSDSVSNFFDAWGQQYSKALLKRFPFHSIKITFIWIDKAPKPTTIGAVPSTFPHPHVDASFDIVHVPITSLLPNIDTSLLR